MLQAVIDRLVSQVSALRGVEGASEFSSAAERGITLTPWAYVIPITERAGPNQAATTVVLQTVIETFGVVLVWKDASDARGSKAAKQLETLRDSVRDAIQGWEPVTGYSPCEYEGARTVGFLHQAVWRLLTFKSEYEARNV